MDSAFRSSGVSVLTPADTGLMGAPDEVHYAGRNHRGIIVAPQRQFSIGEQVRRILRLRAALSAESMVNRLEFLVNWK